MQLNRARYFAGILLCIAGQQVAAQSDSEVVVVGENLPEAFASLDEKPRLATPNTLSDALAAGAEVLYIETAPLEDDFQAALAGLPAGQKLVVAVNTCGWDDTFDPQSLRSTSIGDTGLVIATPDAAGECDSATLAKGFVIALQQDKLTDALQDNGYQLLGNGLVPAASSAPLVITALPVSTGDSEMTPTLVSLNTGPVTRPQTASTEAINSGPAVRNSDGPEPSIIVGDLAVVMSAGARSPLGMPYDAREAIRQRDPAMYARLLAQGAFDPDTEQLASAMQTELARMECYAGTIDGAWGAGSVSALQRYYDTADMSRDETTPTISLYRAVLSNDAVECPAVQTAAPTPVRAQPVRQQTTRASSTRNTAQPRRVAPQPQPQPQPAAPSQPRAAPRIDGSLVGTGTGFRQ